MSYNLQLAQRIRSELGGLPFVEKKMFGVGFLLRGNMACGVNKDEFIVRVDPAEPTALLKRPHVRPFDITRRPMKGWIVVQEAGIKTSKQPNTWVKEGVAFALTLPPE